MSTFVPPVVENPPTEVALNIGVSSLKFSVKSVDPTTEVGMMANAAAVRTKNDRIYENPPKNRSESLFPPEVFFDYLTMMRPNLDVLPHILNSGGFRVSP
jgi:hypothetical protein